MPTNPAAAPPEDEARRLAKNYAVVGPGMSGTTNDEAEALEWLRNNPAASIYVPMRALSAAESRGEERGRATDDERFLKLTASKSHECWSDESHEECLGACACVCHRARTEGEERGRREALEEAGSALELLERNMNYGPSVTDALLTLRALSGADPKGPEPKPREDGA